MSQVSPGKGPNDPRILFAAEQVLLAWVRTGLSMMGFGFVVARFGIFLREIAMTQALPPSRPGLSLWVGIALVVLGVTANVCAVLKHWRIVRKLQRGEPLVITAWSLATAVALLLAVIGLFMAAYLVLGLHPEA